MSTEIMTNRKQLKVWKTSTRNRLLYAGDESFYISYNPGNFDSMAFISDNGGSETAIVKDSQFYILNGDFTKEYEETIDKGFDACIQIFLSHPELHSSWSNVYEGDKQ